MAKSKKAKSKKVSKKAETKKSNDQVEARPIGEGKDPLAEGNTLENPTNTEAETHYKVKERSEDVQKTSKIAGKNANERAEVHNAQQAQPHNSSNESNEDLADATEGREGR